MRLHFSWFMMLLVFSSIASSQSIVQFKAGKPYAVLSFLETAGGTQQHSATFSRYIDSAISKDDQFFKNIIRDFQQLNLSYNYRRDEYPANRRQTRSTYDLIVIAAVKSSSLKEFRVNTIGILSNSAHQELFRLLVAAEPYYDRIIGQQSQKALREQITGFNKYAGKASELFRAFRTFYQSSWPDDIPFNVSLFPVPGKQGNTSATPHANSLCVAVLTGNKDLAGTMGVVMHEICHVLYDEQTISFQHALDALFNSNQSPYKNIAYGFFDEALATALGNGWAYQYFSGKTDTTAWYNNEYIDGFAHAIYPLVQEYLKKEKPMDSVFVDSAITLFGKTYPRSPADFGILLNNMSLYTDAEEMNERNQLKKTLGKYFQASRYNFSAPVLHEYSIESIKNSKATQLIVVDRNQDTTIDELRKVLPGLDGILQGHKEQNYIAAFYDNLKRPVIVICVSNSDMLDKAFQSLKIKRYLDAGMPVFPVE